MQVLLEKFKNKNVLIIGDFMLDAYISGKVDRISPEAPVPVVSEDDHFTRLGGAANVALNINSLHANAFLVALIGEDEDAKKGIQLFQDKKISSKYLVASKTRKTTIKTRILSKGHQLLRIDKEDVHDADDLENELLIQNIQAVLKDYSIDIAILEDYNKGVLNTKNIPIILDILKQKNIPIAVDPKVKNFTLYKDVTLFKPNLKELSKGINVEIDVKKLASLKSASHNLRNQINNQITLLTLSEHGMYIENQSEEILIPTHSLDVSDVSGAGDTVIAIASLAYTTGATIKEIAEISNIGAGIVCQKIGVEAITWQELNESLLK